MAFAAGTVILIILICILFASVSAEAVYGADGLSLKVAIMGITVFKTKKSEKSDATAAPERKAEKLEKGTQSLCEKLKRFTELCKTAVKLLGRYVKIETAELRLAIGTGDAAVTAVSTGALWAVIYTLLGIVGRIVCIENHSVQIAPNYTETVFLADGKCIIKSRVVYIIIIAITILIKIKALTGKEE